MPPRNLVDIETGELIEDVVKVVTEKQDTEIKRLFAMTEANKEFFNENGSFIFKRDSSAVEKIESKITDSDIAKVMYLATYLDYDSYLKSEGGRPLKKSDIKDIIGVNRNLFNTWYSKMIQLKVITEDDKGVHMNKTMYLKGTLPKGKDYDRLFVQGARQIYEDNKTKNQTMLGTVIRLLPYVNTHHNVLCWNPQESELEKVEHITVGEVAKQLGYGNDTKRLMDAISKIRVFDNHPVMLFFNDNGSLSDMHIMFHPKICYSGKNEQLKDTYKLFVMMSHTHKDKSSIDGKVVERKLIRRGD